MKKVIPIIILVLLIIGGAVCFYLYQYTEVFGKKIIPINYKTATLSYVPGYSLDAAKEMNKEKEVVQVQTIKKKDLEQVLKELKKVKKSESKKDIVTNYEITLDKVIVKIGDKYGTVTKGKNVTKIKVTDSLISRIEEVVDNNNNGLIKELTTDTATVKLDGASISIKNEDNLKYIKKELNYYPITMDADYKKYDEGYKAELQLDNSVKVYLYSNRIGYIVNDEEKTYGIFQEDLLDLLNQIYEVSTK